MSQGPYQVPNSSTNILLNNDQMVADVLVCNPGSGYATAPTVTIDPPPPGGAQAYATATIAGPITGIYVTAGGSNYTYAPTVNFSGGGGGSSVAAKAFIDTNSQSPTYGQVVAVLITNQGYGYSSPPSISFSGGGGSGAQAIATMSVTGLTITNQGSGYTSNPNVTFSAPDHPGARPNTTVSISDGRVTGISLSRGLLPIGSPSYIAFSDSNTGMQANLSLIISTDNSSNPIITADQGFIIKKDLQVGGFIASAQGAISLNHGLSGYPTPASPPCIQMVDSAVPYPYGSSFPTSPQSAQLFWLTAGYNWNGQNYSSGYYMWNGSTWINKSSFSGLYDTLFLFQADGMTPAHLDLGNLTVHGNLTVEGQSSFGANLPLWIVSGVLSILQATTSQNGYLSSTDWNTFNGKISPYSNTTLANISITDGSAITPVDDNQSFVGTMSKMWNSICTRNLQMGIAGSNYVTFSIDSTGLILNFDTTSNTGGILPNGNKTLALGSPTNKWHDIYCTNLTANNLSAGTGGTIVLQTPINFNNQPLSNYLGSLGSGTPSSSTYLRGDGTWQPLPTNPSFSGLTVNGNANISGTVNASWFYAYLSSYGIGTEANTLVFKSDYNFKWYQQATQTMYLDSSGNLTAAANIFANKSQIGYFTPPYGSAMGGIIFGGTNKCYLGCLDDDILYFDTDASTGGILPVRSSSYVLGSNINYWSYVYANYLRYHTNNVQFDAYDDLTLVKLWGEKEPTIPENYDAAKTKPPSEDPFEMLKGKTVDGKVDQDFFDAESVLSFALGCAKALAKKQDTYDETLLELLNKIEAQQKEIDGLTLQLQKLTATGGVSA